MDPFSFAASILAVVETTGKVTVMIARYVSSVKRAEESRLRLFQEVSVIDGILRAMKGLVDYLIAEKSAESITRVNALASLEEKGFLSQCEETLQGILGWLDTGSKMKIGQRLLWPLRQEKRTMEFLQKLERYKSIFTLALSVESL